MHRSAVHTLLLSALATLWGSAALGAQAPAAPDAKRPLPPPIEYPSGYARALEAGTRSPDGGPGPRYWQNWADYQLEARLDPAAKRLYATATIRYANRSPDSLRALYLNLSQNVHGDGAPRKIPVEVTGGMTLERVALDGQRLEAVAPPEQEAGEAGAERGAPPGYHVEATRLELRPPRPIAPAGETTLQLDWRFDIPQAGADHRMGWDSDNLFFLAYWYPQLAVYDDVVGWQTDWFLGRAEFYAGFGNYTFSVEVPSGWVVNATGTLQNPEEVLRPEVLSRLRRAEGSDEVVHVIGADDLGNATAAAPRAGALTWRFQADSVRDVAFAVTRASRWDAMRTPVGDRDGDGTADFARVDALYREGAPLWKDVAAYARHAIAFHSRFTDFPYPWPHMTAVEGAGIISGGMEFPMMTLMGDYNARGDSALYFVTTHELAHMWFPMSFSSDERRYAWLDEGTTTFNENQSSKDYFPGFNPDTIDQNSYLELARAGSEGEIMRRSDYHYSRDAYGIASYEKPASLLVALRALLGEETFRRAYHDFARHWAFKHPYPWDFFNAFESASGRDLDWFFSSWYYETWTLDQAVADVRLTPEGTRIIIEDHGRTPMPARVTITHGDGRVIQHEINVDVWLAGARRAEIVVDDDVQVVRVEIDPGRAFPDIDRTNNVWER